MIPSGVFGDLPHQFGQRVSRPRNSLSWSEIRNVRKLAEILKELIKRRFDAALGRHRDRPCLLSYSSDSTPIATLETYSAAEWNHLKVRRRGRLNNHFIIQRAWLRTADDLNVIFTEPFRVADGTAWTAWTACTQLVPTLREAGHRGLAISHHCEDRLLFSSMDRIMNKHHNYIDHQIGLRESPGQVRLLHLLHWQVHSGCSCHDAHNAYKWSVLRDNSDPERLKSAFIIVESMRNAYSQLLANLGSWLATVLTFADYEHDEFRSMWVLLGVEPQLIDLLEHLQLRFRSGRLLVASKFEGDSTALELIATALMGVWRFVEWSDSRWASMSSSCRTMIACFLTGLGSLVGFVRSQRCESDYYIGGFSRCTDEVKMLFAVGGIAGWVADTCLELLLEDDRLPARMSILERELNLEVDYVTTLSDTILTTIAEVVGTSCRALRSAVNGAALTAAGFILSRSGRPRRCHGLSVEATKPPSCSASSTARGPKRPQPPRFGTSSPWATTARSSCRASSSSRPSPGPPPRQNKVACPSACWPRHTKATDRTRCGLGRWWPASHPCCLRPHRGSAR